MMSHRATDPEGLRRAALAAHAGERGSSLILVLVFALLVTLLAMSVLFSSDVEFLTSKNHDDAHLALSDLDSALSEVIYRLNLEPGASAPPAGSQVSVNNLVNYDAALDPDPWDLLDNDTDDDGDGTIDEADELMLVRDWEARILLTPDEPNPGAPYEEADADAATGPPWGSKVVEATIQPEASWKLYSSDDVTATAVLKMRFKKDTDTPLGDSEGDGAELLFWDWLLVRNGIEDKNTLTSLGGNGNPADDSPYNITWNDGVGNIYPAQGSPVILIEAEARLERAGKVVATRKVTAEAIYPMRQVMSKAICGCGTVDMNGVPDTDSYKSSEGEYGTGSTYENGHVGANGNLILDGDIKGDAEAGGTISGADSAAGDAIAGGSITGTPGDLLQPFTNPPPTPCLCEEIDVADMVADALADNDNAALAAGCQGPNLNLNGNAACTFPCGDYYFESIDIGGNADITIDSSCGPVRVFLADVSDMQGTGFIHVGRPEDFQIWSTATELDFGGTSDFVGVVYAPDAAITLHGNNDISGAILGETVDVSGNPAVHYDEDLADVWRARSSFKILSWREE